LHNELPGAVSSAGWPVSSLAARQPSCGNCLCQRNEGDRPVYNPRVANDLNWCLGTSNNTYHCSTAIVIGTALDQ
jgi:methylamine dehydrogenase light chain